MVRKMLIGAGAIVLALAATAGILFFVNSTPEVPPLSQAEAAQPTKPYVIKLHAQWCSVCLATKDEWEQIQQGYADRVNLVVFDSTDEASTAGSRVEAKRLGLEALIDEYQGATGMVLVVDPATRKVLSEIAGIQPIGNYRDAIDASLSTRAPAG
jgi:thiol-disulfide isomerase/thioredoxin